MTTDKAFWVALPREVRIAFALAFNHSEVVPALRMAAKLQGVRLDGYCNYLHGAHFAGIDWEDEDTFGRLRSSAQGAE